MTLHWRNLWSDTAPGAAWEYGRYRHYTRLHWAIWWVRATLDWWRIGRRWAVLVAARDAAEREGFRRDCLQWTIDKFDRAPLPERATPAADRMVIAESEWDATVAALAQRGIDEAIGWDPVARVYRPVPVSWFPPIPGRDR